VGRRRPLLLGRQQRAHPARRRHRQDTFQIGQLFGANASSTPGTGDGRARDEVATIKTTRGELSARHLLRDDVYGGDDDDDFLVYSTRRS
jgi:hypothetical protein